MSFPTPEYHSHEEFINRSSKLKEIKELKVDPYPHTYTPSHRAGLLQKECENEEVGHSEDAGSGNTKEASLAGRLILFRAMGKNAFAHLQDDTGKIQLMFNRDTTAIEGFSGTEELSPYKFIQKKLDLGDIIGVKGHLFRTQKGELTLFVKSCTLLCKSLLPLPDKHSGLADKGTRYRKRWLDLISNQEIATTFKVRSQIIRYIRTYFEKEGFLEVETPVLQNIYGGAEARPFTTHLQSLNQEMFLRISLEIPLKKLIVGGMEKVFEIGKVFRNEGIDRTHNPEFTEIEAYAAYHDYNDMMHLVETLFEGIAIHLFGTTKIAFEQNPDEPPQIVDMKAPWKRITMIDSLKEYANIDVEALSDDAMRTLLEEKGSTDPKKIKNGSRGALIALLFEEFVEEYLIQPHHITDHPIETTPLCKLHREEKWRSKKIVERFESFVMKSELCNSYTELNDPELQRELLLQQAEKKLEGDAEASPLDEEFIEAICQGMPPTGGLGIGIDRLVMLFTKAYSIRDVLYFPMMRPEEG